MRPRLVMALALPFSFVAGHLVGFAAHTTHADRALAEAGHEYLSSLGAVAVPLLAASLLLALVAGARHQPFRPRYGSTAAQFAAVFAGLELLEHLVAGWSLSHVLSEPALWLGLATQLVVAGIVVALVRLFVRVGRLLRRAMRPSSPRRGRVLSPPILPAVGAVALTSIRRRGPPARRALPI